MQTAEPQRLVPAATARAEAAWLADDIGSIVTEIDLAWSAAVAHPDPWELGELSWWLSVADVKRTVPITLAQPFEMMLCGSWREAAAVWQDIGCPPWAALCLGLGNEPDGVRKAFTMLDELHAPAVREAVLRHRRARGLPALRAPHTTSRGNPAQLTVRELDVLRLVANGLSNLEVGHELFISEKTVGHHMSAVLRKLGEPTRARAVAQALRAGIITQT